MLRGNPRGASSHCWHDSHLLGRAERSTPEARRARLGRAGLTAKARAEPQWPMPWMRLAGVGTERAFSIRCFQVFAPAANSQCCFVLVRRSIIQRRMQPLTVVDGFDKGPDGASGLIQIAVAASVDLLRLQGLHEAFGLGILVRIADTAHAGLDIVYRQDFHIFAASVLHPTIG